MPEALIKETQTAAGIMVGTFALVAVAAYFLG